MTGCLKKQKECYNILLKWERQAILKTLHITWEAIPSWMDWEWCNTLPMTWDNPWHLLYSVLNGYPPPGYRPIFIGIKANHEE
jgi:hypothetical protein